MANSFESKIKELAEASETYKKLKRDLEDCNAMLQDMKTGSKLQLSQNFVCLKEDDSYTLGAEVRIITSEQVRVIKEMLSTKICEIESEIKEMEHKYNLK